MAKRAAKNPYLSIWLHPRETIRDIIETDVKRGFLVLCVLYGFPMALSFAQSFSLASIVPLWAILLAGVILSPFLGYLGINISTCLLKLTGKWLGGEGSYQTIRAAVAWSNLPNVLTVATWLVEIAVFGGFVFCQEFSEAYFTGYQSGVIFLVFLVQSITSIWGLILLLKALGEVQGFSTWKALLNVLIPFIIVVALAWLIGWAIWGTNSIIK